MRIRKEAQLQVGQILRELKNASFDSRVIDDSRRVDVEITGIYPDIVTGIIHHDSDCMRSGYDETVTITNVQLVQMGIYGDADLAYGYYWKPEPETFLYDIKTHGLQGDIV